MKRVQRCLCPCMGPPFQALFLGFAYLASLAFRRVRCVLCSKYTLERVKAARGNLRQLIEVSRGEAALLGGSAKPSRTF